MIVVKIKSFVEVRGRAHMVVMVTVTSMWLRLSNDYQHP